MADGHPKTIWLLSCITSLDFETMEHKPYELNLVRCQSYTIFEKKWAMRKLTIVSKYEPWAKSLNNSDHRSRSRWPTATLQASDTWTLSRVKSIMNVSMMSIPQGSQSQMAPLYWQVHAVQHCARIAFNTGTVKPAVLPKQVPWVRVRSRFLPHRDTPRTRAAVLWVPTGSLS